jgi:T1SS-143 domain-containing protein
VDDDTPLVILPLDSTVDEDGPLPIITGLPGSNPLGNGDNVLALTTATNILGISWGADNNNPTSGTGYKDGDRAVVFTEDNINALTNLGRTSDGLPISYALSENDTVLTATISRGDKDVTVFTVELSDKGIGYYTFNLYNNLDHKVSGTEDNLAFDFEFRAYDSDGDSKTGSFTVSVDDDTPLALLPLNSTVDEDGPLPIITGLPGSNPGGDGDDASGPFALPIPGQPTVFNTLGISWGADNNNPTSDTGYNPDKPGDRAVVFSDGAIAALKAQNLNLKSDGLTIDYRPEAEGTRLVAFITPASGPEKIVFTVELSDAGPLDAGLYTFTLRNNIDHPPNTNPAENEVKFTFNFDAIDSDGDKATSSFTVTVDDDTPVFAFAPLNSTVDEDGPVSSISSLPGSNAGGVGDDNFAGLVALPVPGQPFVTNLLGISWGADNNNPTSDTGYKVGDRAVVFSDGAIAALKAQNLNLKSDGLTIDYRREAEGTRLVAFITPASGPEKIVFTVELSDAGPLDAGLYTFTLRNNIDHPPNTNPAENEVKFTFNFDAIDSDGDKATSSFTVTVDDDTPVFFAAPGNSTVDEDGVRFLGGGLPGSNPGGVGDDTRSTILPFNPDQRSAINSLGISWGADNNNPTTGTGHQAGDRAVIFADSAIDTLKVLDLKSGGVLLKFALNTARTELTGYVGSDPTSTAPAGGQIFKVTLADAGGLLDGGTYTFTLLGPLDHLVADTEDNRDLRFEFVAIDSDGDTATSSFTVSVDDDTPVVPEAAVVASFTDDEAVGLQTANTTNNSGSDTRNEPGTATDVAGALFSIGADGLRSVALTNVTAERPTGLFSTTSVNPLQAVFKDANGFSVLENVSFGPGVVGPSGTTTFTATGTSGGIAGTLVIRADGSYTFTQVAPFEHTGGNSGEEDLFINIAYRVTDKDGDTASNTLRVRVDDDAPTTRGNITAGTTTDDDVQTEFPGNAGGSGDDGDGRVAQGGAGALFSVGADGLRSIVMTNPMPSLSTVYKNTAGFAQTEDATWGAPVTSAGGKTTWIATSANNGEVARLEISADGSYTFTQSAPLVHASTGSTTEDNVSLAFNYAITDGDGDTVTGSLTVNIDDDTPVAQDDTRTIDEDAPAATIDLLANDSAGADGLRSVTLQGSPVFTPGATAPTGAGGTFSLSDAGILSFTPAANWNGTATVTYKLTDGDGDSIDRTATFTVSAVNDAPTLASVAAVSYVDTAVDNTFTAATGTLNGADVDRNTLTYGITGGSATSTTISGVTYTQALVGTYGTLYLVTSGADAGKYRFEPNDAAIEARKTGASDNFTLTTSDGSLFASTVLTVNITGANDTPTFSGQSSSAVTEDGTLTTGGTLTVADRDANESTFQPQTNAPGTYGTFSITTAGVWTYTLSNTAPNVQALNAGQTPTDVFTVSSADGTNTSVTVTVNGANDAVAVDAGPNFAFTRNSSSPNNIRLNFADLFVGQTGPTAYTFTWLKPANDLDGINWLTLPTGDATVATANLNAVDADSSGMSIAQVSATTGGITVTNYVAFMLLNDSSLIGLFNAETINVTNFVDAFFAGGDVGDDIRLNLGNYGTVASPVDAGGGDDIIRNLTGTGRAVIGGTGNDALYGNSGNDTYAGGDGFDYLSGAGGNDSLFGNDGDDVLLGGAGNDTLSGGDDEDTLVGGDGNDSLSGGRENDLLVGGAGVDRLTGGSGADAFRLQSITEGTDQILDFGGSDVIELDGSEFGMGSFIGLLSTHPSIADGVGTNDIFQVITAGNATAGNDARFLAFNQAGSNATSFYYDADGGTDGGRVLLATLENGFDLSAEHIRIV